MTETPPASTTGAFAELIRCRRRLVAPFLWGLLALNALTVAAWLLALAPVRTDISFPEGALAERIWAVSLGRPAYSDWREWPHAFAPYGPLTYYPAGIASRWLPGPATAHRAELLGRLQSLLAMAGVAALLFLIGRRIGLSAAWAIVAIALEALWAPANGMGGSLLAFLTSCRPDAPAAFFSIAALYVIVRGSATTRRILGALALIAIATAYKPTAWGILAVVACWIVAGTGWRRAAAWLAGFGALLIAIACLLDRHWHGLLALNMITANRQGFSFDFVKSVFADPRAPSLWIMLLGAAAAARTVLAQRESAALCWTALGALASFGAGLAMGLKTGADINYLALPYPLLVLIFTRELSKLWREESAAPPRLREAGLWLAAIPLALFQLSTLAEVRAGFVERVREWRQTTVVQHLQNPRGPILSPNPFVALETGSPPTVMDAYVYSSLTAQGMIDPAPLRERMRDGAFAAIVMNDTDLSRRDWGGPDRFPFYCSDFWDLLAERYAMTEAYGVFKVFTPRAAAQTKPDASPEWR